MTWVVLLLNLLALSLFRASTRLRLPNKILVQNAVCPRAFMSSSAATEAFQEIKPSQAYGADQIQVM